MFADTIDEGAGSKQEVSKSRKSSSSSITEWWLRNKYREKVTLPLTKKIEIILRIKLHKALHTRSCI